MLLRSAEKEKRKRRRWRITCFVDLASCYDETTKRVSGISSPSSSNCGTGQDKQKHRARPEANNKPVVLFIFTKNNGIFTKRSNRPSTSPIQRTPKQTASDSTVIPTRSSARVGAIAKSSEPRSQPTPPVKVTHLLSTRLLPDVELRSASVLDYRIWLPQGRVTMLHGSLGTHRALSQI